MRILILGGGGMLGHKLWQELPKLSSDTWVTLRKEKSFYRNCEGLFESSKVIEGVDAADFPNLERVLGEVAPEVIINCVAITKRHENPERVAPTIQLNSLLPHQLAEWGRKNRARLIHFSTDCVFNGVDGGYSEKSPVNAEDIYGRTKALGEVSYLNAVTIRSSFVGRELNRGTELLEWFLSQKGKKVKGFRQALYTGMTTLTATNLVRKLIEGYPKLHGVFQVASEVINKYDLLVLFRDAFQVDIEIVPDESFVCRRNLDGSKFAELTGFACPSWKEMVFSMAEDPTPYENWKSDRK